MIDVKDNLCLNNICIVFLVKFILIFSDFISNLTVKNF